MIHIVLRAPWFISFAIIITLFQVFQIAITHIPYPFNIVGNEMQALYIQKDTYVCNGGNWQNIGRMDNKTRDKDRNENLSKKYNTIMNETNNDYITLTSTSFLQRIQKFILKNAHILLTIVLIIILFLLIEIYETHNFDNEMTNSKDRRYHPRFESAENLNEFDLEEKEHSSVKYTSLEPETLLKALYHKLCDYANNIKI
ncbi:uncharacterized protein LOC105186525 [Harpegnathos saltator]|uniref:uncharacterized protein LOC105186525 n=1 Tax=Harpegnathos saltator TaxID=610380 RepID=UPI00058F3260|nr:uncharacterized protein LOC105186525 [Harpegnathos saltator]XP_019698497.1 uncharacterized protein LOC105186525 [Harpegnathos saltator]XP_019698498.1 uncharacterized protein LOC105186525 [Harpegnathos saltator]